MQKGAENILQEKNTADPCLLIKVCNILVVGIPQNILRVLGGCPTHTIQHLAEITIDLYISTRGMPDLGQLDGISRPL